MAAPASSPIAVVTNEEFGTHIVATRNLPKGTTVLEDGKIFQLYVAPNTCFECGSPALPLLGAVGCSGHQGKCGLLFCSTRCADLAWYSYHLLHDATHTKGVIEWAKQGISSTRLLPVVLAKIAAMQLLYDHSNNKVAVRVLRILQGVPRERAKFNLEGVISAVNCMLAGASVSKEWVIATAATVLKYSFGAKDRTIIRKNSNFFNHKCTPNVEPHPKNDEAWVTSRDVNAGEQLFITYLQYKYPRATRNWRLQQMYEFRCSCELCVRDTKRNCDHCGAEEAKGPAKGLPLKQCQGCLEALYCSQECQKKNWPSHKRFCKHQASVLKSFARMREESRSDNPAHHEPLQPVLVVARKATLEALSQGKV